MITPNTFSKINLTIIILLIVFLISGCDIKVGVLGYPQEIFIVADSSLWKEVGPEITEVFETINKHTSEKFGISIEFPNDEKMFVEYDELK